MSEEELREYAVILTNKGEKIIVDQDDLQRVNHFSWRVAPHGYVVFHLKRKGRMKETRLHTVILHSCPKMHIDHINHDKLDNRKSNLRVCHPRQNQYNQVKKATASSKYKGVCFYKSRNKWVANIKLPTKLKHLGYFDNELEAAKAYDVAAIKYFGEYAYPNL